MSKFNMWLLLWVLKRIYSQDGFHGHNTQLIFTGVAKEVRELCHEDNVPTFSFFLHDALDNAIDNITKHER